MARKKKSLFGQILKGFVKGVMSEPSKQHRSAIRKAQRQRRKGF